MNLPELKRLAEAATPGPWKACGTIYEHMNAEVRSGPKGEGQGIAQVWDGPNGFADAAFIAAARTAVPALISRIEEMEGALEPFAAMATAGDQTPKDDAVWAGQDGKRITYGDFRRAARARQALKTEGA